MNLPYKKTSWFVLLLTATTLVVFWPLYCGDYTLRGEAADLVLPALSHMRQAIMIGEWPLWNPRQLQGIDTSVLPLYWNPVYILSAVLFASPHLALNAVYLFLLFISGLGFYKFAGLFFEDNLLAILGGLSYPMVGFFVIQSQYLDMICASAWLPFILYALFRYQTTGQVKHLILLAGGYYLFTTGSSQGFVFVLSGFIIFLLLYMLYKKRCPRARLWKMLFVLTGAVFLVMRIYWLRWLHFELSGEVIPMTSGVWISLRNLVSLVLPQLTSILHKSAEVSYSPGIHLFIGTIVLLLALVALILDRIKAPRNLRKAWVALLVLSVLSPVLEPGISGFTSISGIAFTATFKILWVMVTILLSLYGLKSVLNQPQSGRVVFIIAGGVLGIAVVLLPRISNFFALEGLQAWHMQLDLLKASFFLFAAGASMWLPGAKARFCLLAGLMVVEIALSNYLTQDGNLKNSSPSSLFTGQISYPEDKKNPIELDMPIGRYSDQDFQLTSLDRNTGTLVNKIVRDGYWPWKYIAQDQVISYDTIHLRFPLFYFSMDQNAETKPSYTNFDDGIAIDYHTDHKWQVSFYTQYEKQLVFNQNFHQNWSARIDDKLVPIRQTNGGMMRVLIAPGLHHIIFEFKSDGLLNVFGITMFILMVLMIYLIRNGLFPYLLVASGIPLILIHLFNLGMQPMKSTFSDQLTEKTAPGNYAINFESHSPFWFFRPEQITPLNSFDGYRSEALNHDAEYSATLQLHRNALHGKIELEYSFRIHSENEIQAGIVIKSYTADDDAYNIRYFKSLDKQDWQLVEGRFSLEELPGPLTRVDFYIWNNRKQDFLIDDIQVKLNP